MKLPKKMRILMGIGMLLISFSIIITLLLPATPDFVKGFLEGSGIGIMLICMVKLIRMKKNVKQQHVTS